MNAIGMHIYVEEGEYEVWIGPAGDLSSDNIINAFVVGTGATRDEAIEMAVRELETLVEQLQSPFDAMASRRTA